MQGNLPKPKDVKGSPASQELGTRKSARTRSATLISLSLSWLYRIDLKPPSDHLLTADQPPFSSCSLYNAAHSPAIALSGPDCMAFQLR